MKKYTALKLFFAVVIAGYFLIGIATNITIHREIFPIFSWDLFSYVPSPQGSDFGIKIINVEGTDINPPLYFEKADNLFLKAHSVDAYSYIQSLGNAILSKQQDQITNTRTLFEPVFLGDKKYVRYIVVQRKYDLLKRWKNNVFISEIDLQTFETEKR